MRIIRALAFIGFTVSAYLFSMKLTGKVTSVVGCGGEGGCADVLGSQWSQWFGIPVSAVSAVFYLGVIALTFKASKPLLTMAAFLLIGAAAWFMGLQAFVIQSFCPWCFSTHMVGLLTAGVILWKARAKVRPVLILVPICLIAGLALGQVYGPKPDTHEEVTDDSLTSRKEVKDQIRGEGRLITFKKPNGELIKSYRLGSVPLIGSPEATHVIVKYYDYTCASCRTMEEDLAFLMERYPKEVAVIVLPTPLNRACNPHLSPQVHDHEHACELARLGMAAWRAQPESFEKAHEILFQRPVHSEKSAREELLTIIPAAKLDAALKDPWVEKSLQANLLDFKVLAARNPKMPKLLVTGGKQLHGLAKSTEEFVKLMGTALGLP
ncbi:MAG: putative membrane protein [Akkermansiaceae bacterium]|jgi:uncharacterized membrane protein